jgi:hypothetical protein
MPHPLNSQTTLQDSALDELRHDFLDPKVAALIYKDLPAEHQGNINLKCFSKETNTTFETNNII